MKNGLPESIQTLLDMVQNKKHYVDMLERLQKMSLRVDEVMPDPAIKTRCKEIKFATDYGAAAYTRTDEDDLQKMLIDVATNYFQERLRTIDLLLGLADEVVRKKVLEVTASDQA